MFCFVFVSFEGKIQRWRERLRKRYLREKGEIRFGKSSFAHASIDELCVDLELIEQDGNPLGDEEEIKGRRLDSYVDLLNLPDQKDHILLFGRAGTGKTTQISRIAYDWAKSTNDVRDSETSSHVSCKSLFAVIKLVLVLDIRHFVSNQTLAQEIKRQLLPGASTDDIDEALDYLGDSCLLLLDGFDEMPKSCQKHALHSSHLSYLFVIVTTRPHTKDQFCVENVGYTQVQVLGFSKEKVCSYIEKFYKVSGKQDMVPSLTQKVKETPLLQTLSSFPMLLVMICLLWEDTNKRGITFHSMTSLYTEAVSKYLNKPFKNREKNRRSWEQFQQMLQTVGKTALTELFEGNIQIDEANFTDVDVLKQGIDSGLMVLAEGKLVDNTSVSFIHKTFQEYCAAVYLSTLISTNKNMFISYLSKISLHNMLEMEYLLRFSCGLCIESAEAVLDHICGIQEEIGSNAEIPLVLLYETELSHGITKVSKYKLHSKLLWGNLQDVSIRHEELLGAVVHFCDENQTMAKATWLSKIKSLKSWSLAFSSVKTIIQVLCSMPSLKSAQINLAVSEDTSSCFDQLPNVILCKSLRKLQFGMKSSKICSINVTSLISLLRCMPALTGMDKRRVMWRRVMGELRLDQVASYG